MTGYKVWDWRKKKKKRKTRALHLGCQAFRQKLPVAPYCVSLQKWPWLKETAAVYSACLCLLQFQWRCCFISSWKSLWGEGRRASLLLNPLSWALSGLTEPSLAANLQERNSRLSSPERRGLYKWSTFTQDPPPTSPYHTAISSFKCLLTGCVCELTVPNFGGILVTTVESWECDVKNNQLTDIKHGVSPGMTWRCRT